MERFEADAPAIEGAIVIVGPGPDAPVEEVDAFVRMVEAVMEDIFGASEPEAVPE